MHVHPRLRNLTSDQDFREPHSNPRINSSDNLIRQYIVKGQVFGHESEITKVISEWVASSDILIRTYAVRVQSQFAVPLSRRG